MITDMKAKPRWYLDNHRDGRVDGRARKPLTILVADDHVLFRKSLAALIAACPETGLVGEACNGQDVIRLTRELKPDVVLMDLLMPSLDGFEATRIIKQEMPQVKVVVLTISENDDHLFGALKHGADGYLLKRFEPQQLFDLLERVHRGEPALPDCFMTKLLQSFQAEQTVPEPVESDKTLSQRELQVLKLLVEGEKNREIAEELEISENTVKIHLRSILEKLNARNRLQAAVIAIREELVT